MTIDEAQVLLEQRLRGKPGFIGTGQDLTAKPGSLVVYVGPGWEQRPDVPATLEGFPIRIKRIGQIKPL